MKLDRRHFLTTSGSALGLALFQYLIPGFAGNALAQLLTPGTDGHFFILIKTSGGMDCTLGLDPQIVSDFDPKDIFIEYRPEDIIQASGLRLGPSAAPLKPFAQDCAIINGIVMGENDAGHEVYREYMSSGSALSKGGVLPVEIAASTGAGPYGIITEESVRLGGREVILSNINDILSTNPNLEAMLDKLERMTKDSAGSPLLKSERALLSARSSMVQLKAVLDKYKQQPGLTLDRKHAMAAAFISGAAKQAQVSLSSVQNVNLDTHSQHEKNHLNSQKLLWEEIAAIFKFFKETEYRNGSSLFDHTTFMVVTEFSRTPALNPALGKDHNQWTNSTLLAGKGVNGGKVFGKSMVVPRDQTDDGLPLHMGAPIDLNTGKAVGNISGANFMRPDNVTKSIAQAFGVPNAFSSLESNVLPIQGLVKL